LFVSIRFLERCIIIRTQLIQHVQNISTNSKCGWMNEMKLFWTDFHTIPDMSANDSSIMICFVSFHRMKTGTDFNTIISHQTKDRQYIMIVMLFAKFVVRFQVGYISNHIRMDFLSSFGHHNTNTNMCGVHLNSYYVRHLDMCLMFSIRLHEDCVHIHTIF